MTNSLQVVNSTPIYPITYPTYSGQPIAAPTIGYNGAGWVAKIVLSGITDVTQVCDATKLTLTVSDPGYDTSGNATTVNRTITGQGPLIRQYEDAIANLSQGSSPNANINYLITTDGTNLTLYIALSDWIYTGTTINSVSLAANFYGSSSATTISSPTNSSDLAYPNVIFGWHTPQYNSTNGTGTLPVEGLAFHRHAMNGQQVACVKYQATDAHSISGAVSTVGASTLSTLAKQGNIPEVFAANVDFSGLTQGDNCTVNAIAYPWLGNNPYAIATYGSITGQGTAWPTQKGQTLLQALCDKTGAYGGAYAYVSLAGNDTTGVVSTSTTVAKASPFATILAAGTALQTYNNATKGHNDLGGATIRLMDSAGSAATHVIPRSFPTATGNTWFTIESDPTNTGVITADGSTSGYNQFPDKLRLRNFTLYPSSGAGRYIFVANTTGALVTDGLTINNSNNKSPFVYWTYQSFYNHTITDPGSSDTYLWSANVYTLVISGAVSTVSTNATNPPQPGIMIGSILPQDYFFFGKNLNGNGYKDNDGIIVYNNRCQVISMTTTPPNAWQTSHFYQQYTMVTNGTNFYYALTNGTSASSGGPTGTGLNITDGSVTWAYIATYNFSLPTGVAYVQNLVENNNASTGNGVGQFFPDNDIVNFTNFVDMHNTYLGGKCNTLYNDQSDSQIAPAGLIKQGTRKYTIVDNRNIKLDGEKLVQGCYGNIAFAYGVGNYGEYSLFGEVNRSPQTIPVNLPGRGGGATNQGYMGMAWHPTATFSLLHNVNALTAGESTGATMVKIMKNYFASYTTGPWGDTNAFPQWVTSTVYAALAACQNAGKCYTTTAGGTSGGTAPTHTSGTVSDGGVSWTFQHNNYAIGGNYTPVTSSPLTNIVQAGQAVLKRDIVGNPRYNNGTGAVGALEAPAPVTIVPAPITQGSVTFAITLTETPSGGNGSYTYQWYMSVTAGTKGTAIAGATSASYTASGLVPGNTYYFTCTVGDTSGIDSAVDSAQIAVGTALGLPKSRSIKRSR
jgi:hypothetical protein